MTQEVEVVSSILLVLIFLPPTGVVVVKSPLVPSPRPPPLTSVEERVAAGGLVLKVPVMDLVVGLERHAHWRVTNTRNWRKLDKNMALFERVTRKCTK